MKQPLRFPWPPLLLHRYVAAEFMPPFSVGLLVFTFVLILHHLFLMMDLFLNRGVELWIVAKMTGLILPMFLPLSVPMAALLGAIICFGRIAEDGELTALKSGGCSLKHYGLPTLVLASVASVGLVFFNLFAAPRSTQEFKAMHYAVASRNPLALFAARVMNNFGEYKVIVDKMDRGKRELSGISIYKTNPGGSPTRIFAPEGRLLADQGGALTLELVGGAVHQPGTEQGGENQYTITKFNKFALRIPVDMRFEDRVVTPREMTLGQLREKIRALRSIKEDPAPWQTETHLRVAIAFAPLAFVILGTGLGLYFRKGGKSVGVGISVVVIILYYGLVLLTVPLASRGTFSPMILTWLPNAVAFGAGAWLWRKVASQ